jgi:hypothetical protein
MAKKNPVTEPASPAAEAPAPAAAAEAAPAVEAPAPTAAPAAAAPEAPKAEATANFKARLQEQLKRAEKLVSEVRGLDRARVEKEIVASFDKALDKALDRVGLVRKSRLEIVEPADKAAPEKADKAA